MNDSKCIASKDTNWVTQLSAAIWETNCSMNNLNKGQQSNTISNT